MEILGSKFKQNLYNNKYLLSPITVSVFCMKNKQKEKTSGAIKCSLLLFSKTFKWMQKEEL